MTKSPYWRALALAFAFALVAAACGSSDDGSTDDASTDDTTASAGGEDEGNQPLGGVDEDEATQALEDAKSAGDETDPAEVVGAAGSIEELEAQWAARRQELVDEIVAAGYGVDPDTNILTGASGFEIDLNDCPADWSDTEGITDDTITIGHTTAQSGNLAAYGNIANGWSAYIDYVNENGGIGGRQINLIVKDDAYVATQTIELVDELLQSEKPFYINTLGSPNTLAVYDKLNDLCVPTPFSMTGHPAWGDPVVHPWTSGSQMSYATEAILWGAWIEQNMADKLPVKIVALVMDNDFGLAYEDGMEAYAEANPDVVAEFVPVRHDPAAPTVVNELTTINAEEPDVFISMTAGNPCLLAIEEAGKNGLKDRLDEEGGAFFTPSVCKAISDWMAPAGDAADGVLIIGGGIKDPTDSQYADDPFISWMNEEVKARGLDPEVTLYAVGFSQYGWPHIELLRLADALPGGLTRSNLIIAMRSMDVNHPQVLDGIKFTLDGAVDGYVIEGSEISRFNAGDQTWVQEGNVVDLNGSSPNCTWTDSGCS